MNQDGRSAFDFKKANEIVNGSDLDYKCGEVITVLDGALQEIKWLEAENKELKGSMEDLELICQADNERFKAEIAVKDVYISQLEDQLHREESLSNIAIDGSIKSDEFISRLEVKLVKAKEVLKEFIKQDVTLTYASGCHWTTEEKCKETEAKINRDAEDLLAKEYPDLFGDQK